MEIVTFSEIQESHKDQIVSSLKEIFFLSTSKKEFDSPEHKELFFEKWCGDYLNLYPQLVFLVFINDRLMGYLTGVEDTNSALVHLRVPGINLYKDLYDVFPAHLHINFHPDSRGMGLGTKLVQHFENYLRKSNVIGLHLVTSPDALNVTFYERLGFNKKFVRNHSGYQVMLMGKELS